MKTITNIYNYNTHLEGIQYAEDVVANKIIACDSIFLACKRFLADINSEKYYLKCNEL